MKRLCFALTLGRPCNRQVMKPLGLCDQHREQPERKPTKSKTDPAYMRAWRANRRNAGVSAAWEGV